MSSLPAWLISKRKSIMHQKANCWWERKAAEKKLKRLKSLVKSQQKSRGQWKQVVKELARYHPKIRCKLKKLEVKKKHQGGLTMNHK